MKMIERCVFHSQVQALKHFYTVSPGNVFMRFFQTVVSPFPYSTPIWRLKPHQFFKVIKSLFTVNKLLPLYFKDRFLKNTVNKTDEFKSRFIFWQFPAQQSGFFKPQLRFNAQSYMWTLNLLFQSDIVTFLN